MTEQTPIRIGIIGAMDAEVASLREEANAADIVRIADMEFCEGRLDGRDVVIAKCGMGKVNAGICAQIMITRFGVNRIINTGVAGSLDARLRIGDFVISTEAVQHDYDVSPIGFQPGEIPYTGLVAFPADETLRALALRAVKDSAPDSAVFEGRICSGDQFIASGAQKESIRQRFGGLCCEMEGAAVAQACHLNHVPWVVIRTVSDSADDSEELSFALFAETAAREGARIVREMVGQIR